MEEPVNSMGITKINKQESTINAASIKQEIDLETFQSESTISELVSDLAIKNENYDEVTIKNESVSDEENSAEPTHLCDIECNTIKCEKDNEIILTPEILNTVGILNQLDLKKEDEENLTYDVVSIKNENDLDISQKEITPQIVPYDKIKKENAEENEGLSPNNVSENYNDLEVKQEVNSEEMIMSNYTDLDCNETTSINADVNTDILENLVVKKEEESMIEDPNSENNVNSEHESPEFEPGTLRTRFRVDRLAIESVSKADQATELQCLEGISVYDQHTLEVGIMEQVDRALEQELDNPSEPESPNVLESGDNETEMERQIRMGEMTPFGTTLNMSTTLPIVPRDGLSEVENYLQNQLELHKNKKQNNIKSRKGKEPHAKENFKGKRIDGKCSKKMKILSQGSTKKKKKRKSEDLGTESKDFVPWTEKSDPVPGETSYINPDEASGSEYCPSESDFINSSEDEKPSKSKEQIATPSSGRKRKIKYNKPYKIPEDWASDDSDWEYSDEEGNIPKNKRSKKELDDGDVDAFNRRIQQWKHEKKQMEDDENTEKFHMFDGDFKIPLDIWNKLFNYQRVGLRWLWELDQQCCGGILGDEMGLGKTVQLIAFMAGLHVSQLKDSDTKYHGLGPSLIVCPTTVMHQWVKEFHTWYPPLRVAILHESGTFSGKQRSRLVGNIVQAGGVLITSYTGATQHKEEILTRRWHYVLLDEGHKIRNPDAQITLMVKQLTTCHRIILSGSPMQNNLKELWSLFDFVFPGKLGTLPVFLEQFAVPITQGGYANASQVQVTTAFKCATILKDTIAPYLLRRMKADVKCHVNLPEKNEQVLFCRLTDEQRDYYRGYVESGEVSHILEGRLKIFMGLINLRKICNHPDLYSGGTKLFEGQNEANLPVEERFGYWGKSGKMIVVETLLKLWKKQEHRVLIFTQSRQMLSIMENFISQSGYKYLKLDGGTSIAARQPLINKFNQDTSYFVMLLTTRVGGLGVNLTGANRVLIYDPDWNPATDTQARERAWRIGQKQSVTVYRLITAGTIEEKMYHRQIFKQFLCNKVLKDPRQRRFFKSNDLYELFTLKETDKEGSTETAAIFAGTDSEVKIDPSKRYRHRKVDPRQSAVAPAITFSQKKAETKRKNEVKKEDSPEQEGSKSASEVQFSNEKIEQMKRLAQVLSQKCVKKASPEKNNGQPKSEVKQTSSNGQQGDSSNDREISNNSISNPSTSKGIERGGSTKKTSSHKKKHKDKKKKRHKDAKFEGETVPHLVKTGESTSRENEEDEKIYATQDEYVLKTLFAKSGLQTAMKHDSIMEGGPADYVLVEGEADRVAKRAVEKLNESRRECWRASSGVPSFTGINGARNFQSKPRFGNSKSAIGGMSTQELIDVIRKRNGIVEAKDADVELLENIRDFVISNGGTVNTKQIVDRFEGRLAEGSSPLFKSLLSKICTFYRAPDKCGYWSLKQEFV